MCNDRARPDCLVQGKNQPIFTLKFHFGLVFSVGFALPNHNCMISTSSSINTLNGDSQVNYLFLCQE